MYFYFLKSDFLNFVMTAVNNSNKDYNIFACFQLKHYL